MMLEEGARKRKGASEKPDVENQDDEKSKTKKEHSIMSYILKGFAALIGIIVLYLVIAPSPIAPKVLITPKPLPYFEGVLEPNTKLQKAVKLLEGKITGPESIASDRNGNLYTGLADGRIVKLTKSGRLREIARTGHNLPNCGTYKAEPDCGRPLGLRFDRDEKWLIVCDAYFGLLQVDPESGEIRTLVPAKKGMDGHPFKFANDLVIASDHTVYFTDSSFKWNRRDNRYAIMEGDGQGRLMSYNLKTGEMATLVSGLYFANGVSLSPDEDFVLVTETTASRVIRYFIKGPKTGIYDLFSENLPGYPDNIRASREGGYWVGMAGIRKWPFSFLDFMGPYPTLRKIVTKIMSQEAIIKLLPSYGLLLKLNERGDIIHSFHDPTGLVIKGVSEIHEDTEEGVLYLGSYNADFVGKLKL